MAQITEIILLSRLLSREHRRATGPEGPPPETRSRL